MNIETIEGMMLMLTAEGLLEITGVDEDGSLRYKPTAKYFESVDLEDDRV